MLSHTPEKGKALDIGTGWHINSAAGFLKQKRPWHLKKQEPRGYLRSLAAVVLWRPHGDSRDAPTPGMRKPEACRGRLY